MGVSFLQQRSIQRCRPLRTGEPERRPDQRHERQSQNVKRCTSSLPSFLLPSFFWEETRGQGPRLFYSLETNPFPPQTLLNQITLAISSEITSSTTLATDMNDRFDNTRTRLRGTMNRMLRMAERGTGIGWRAWLAFALAVFLLFAWIWLF